MRYKIYINDRQGDQALIFQYHSFVVAGANEG
jgi:hypothetical protein